MRKMSLRFLFCSLLFFILYGCNNDMEDYYKRPEYLRGNAYEYLKEKGNYTYFIQALEMVGFSEALDGRGLYSVFAADDEAFKRFMTKHGKSSLQDFHLDSLRMMISYHLIEFSFNREDFEAFTVTASAEEPEEGDGTSYKFETLAQEKFKTVKDPVTGQKKDVYQQKKFLPIISTTLLKTQESADYEGDYKMFFPNINWQGDNRKLYVANAAVLESGIPIDNGYMYLVDEVIDLLPTVYQTLNKTETNGKSYKIFKELYDRFANLQYDPDKTKDFAELGDSLFMFYHYLAPKTGQDLPDLACEWTVSENGGGYEDRLKYAVNCFAPNDEVLKAYIEKFWEGTYNYQDVPLLNLYYLLEAHATNRQTLILPSLIDQGLEGFYGEKIPLKREDIELSEFCSNGILYGINQVFEPAVFSLVMQPLFKYGYFSTMLNVAHKRDVLTTMVDPDREYTIFTIKDETLKEEYGYFADLNGNPTINDVIDKRVVIRRYLRPASNVVGDQEVDKTLVEMSWEEQDMFIDNQIVDGYISPERRNDGIRQFYPTKRPFHFIYTEGEELYGEDKQPVNIIKTWEYDKYENGDGRGVVYELDDKFGSNKENIGRYLFDNSSQYKKFYQALLRAKLIQLFPENATTDEEVIGVNMDWLAGERLMVFAPTNDIWDETIVPIDSLERDKFLKYFFVPMIANDLTDYILPNYGRENADLSTSSPITSLTMKMIGVKFVDDKRLRVTNGDGISVFTDGNIPFFATDGLVFGIDGMIVPGENK